MRRQEKENFAVKLKEDLDAVDEFKRKRSAMQAAGTDLTLAAIDRNRKCHHMELDAEAAERQSRKKRRKSWLPTKIRALTAEQA